MNRSDINLSVFGGLTADAFIRLFIFKRVADET